MLMSKTGRFLFWFLTLAVGLASMRILILDAETGYPGMLHHLPDRVVIFGVHAIAASIAMITLPFQFWTRLRVRRPAVHRWVGRLYVLGVLFGGLSGMALAPYADSGAVAASGFLTLSVLWLGVTGMAFVAIRKRDIAAHKRWMIRSMALTFAAVTLRIMLPVSLAMGIPFETAYPAIAWLCWTVNLAAVELWPYLTRRPLVAG